MKRTGKTRAGLASRLLLVRGRRAFQRPFEPCGLADRLPFVDAVVPQAP